MKISEVPQDDIKTMQGEKSRICAVDDQGRYAKTTTSGWEAEEIVLKQAIGDFEGKDGTAAILGLHPSTLRAMMHKLGIVRPETKEPD